MASVVREGVARAEVVRERVVRAVVRPCGTKDNFRGEVYEFAGPVHAEDGVSTPGTFFWFLRWVVDLLRRPDASHSAWSNDRLVGRWSFLVGGGRDAVR